MPLRLANASSAFLMQGFQVSVKRGRLTSCIDSVLRVRPSHNKRAQQLLSPSV
jgi:hypothetical protein